jgi:hypothetical protein
MPERVILKHSFEQMGYSFTIFFDLEEIIFETFSMSENNN